MDSRTLDQKKTLQSSNASKAANENDEFEKQRIAAIAEVAKSKEVGKSRKEFFGEIRWCLNVPRYTLT